MKNISYKEAREILLTVSLALGASPVAIQDCVGRTLAEDVVASRDHPARDTAAMDGFAGAFEELIRGSNFPITGESSPGQTDLVGRTTGVVRISTGAGLPTGCDTVVPVEDTRVVGADTIALTRMPQKTGAHVRRRAEHLSQGTILYTRGEVLGVQDVWTLANLGRSHVSCHRPIVVGVVSGGDELVPLGQSIQTGQEYNGNSVGLSTWIKGLGGEAREYTFAQDDLTQVTKMLTMALRECDCVVTVGAASKGKRDFIRQAIVDLAGEFSFQGVRMRPGKPTAYATCQGKPVFVLPGNPVSAAVGFHLFVASVIQPHQTSSIKKAKVIGHHQGFRAGFAYFLRGRYTVEEGQPLVDVLKQQGSHCFTSIAQSDVLVCVPENRTDLKDGEWVEVMAWQR